jgi:hypothetical protein
MPFTPSAAFEGRIQVSNKIGEFFAKVEADFKDVGSDIKAALTKLFGSNFVSKLESTAQSILNSDLGKAVLADGTALLAEVESGSLSQADAIAQLAKQVETSAKATGVALETSMSTMIASAAIAKVSGVVGSAPSAPAPAAPPSAPVGTGG